MTFDFGSFALGAVIAAVLMAIMLDRVHWRGVAAARADERNRLAKAGFCAKCADTAPVIEVLQRLDPSFSLRGVTWTGGRDGEDPLALIGAAIRLARKLP